MKYVLIGILIFIAAIWYYAQKAKKEMTEDDNKNNTNFYYKKVDEGKTLSTFRVNNTKMTLKYDGLYVRQRTRPKNLIMSKRGLYPDEILMLSYVHKFHTGENNFQSFWHYKYNEDPQMLLNKLIFEGFVEIDNDLCMVLEKTTVDKLKSVLSSCGEKISGRKEELIHRIIEKVPAHVIEEAFPLRYYMLTEEGEAELSENIDVVHCHRDGGDLWDYPYLE